jgi:hypothetical protein
MTRRYTPEEQNWCFADDNETAPGTDDPNVMIFLDGPESYRFQKTVKETAPQKMSEVGTVGYPKGAAYTFDQQPITDLEDLFHLIAEASDWTHSYVVRGAYALSHIKDGKVSRIHSDGSLIDAARTWAMIDVDNTTISFPPDWRDSEPEWLRKVITEIMPDDFHAAGCVWAYSSKQHINGGQPKGHLFFLFDRPMYSHEVKDWAGGLADTSVLTPSQPHLIARPVFTRPVRQGFFINREEIDDPFGDRRVVLLDGPAVQTPTDKELAAMHPQVAPRAAAGASDGANNGPPAGAYGWTRWLQRYGEKQHTGDGLNGVNLRLTMSYCALTPPRQRDLEMLRAVAQAAVSAAVLEGKLERSTGEIEKELGPKFTDMFKRAEAKAADRWGAISIRPADPDDRDRLSVRADPRQLMPLDYSDPDPEVLKAYLDSKKGKGFWDGR